MTQTPLEPRYSLPEEEPVLLSAPLIGALVDLVSGTGLNSHIAGLVAAVLVAALRFILTSPATTKRLQARASIPPESATGS